MDFVSASEAMAAARQAAVNKATLSVPQMLLRGALAGALLGYATSLALIIVSQGVVPIVAALCFPVGFVMLVLLGLELATGNFAIMSFGVAGSEIGWRDVARNWSWVYAGNLIGSLVYAVLFYLAITNMGSAAGGPLADQVRKIAQAKTLGYAAFGARGVAAAFIKGVLCNWMVTLGAVLAFASRSTIGKIVAMWLPIATFFAHGYEHSIVNMFVIPAGMLLGAPVPPAAWWVWNQIPVTIGNLAGGVLFTGLALHLAYPPRVAPAASPARAPTAF